MSAKETLKHPAKPIHVSASLPWKQTPPVRKIVDSASEIPSAGPEEDVEALVRKITALQSLAGHPVPGDNPAPASSPSAASFSSSPKMVFSGGTGIPPIVHPEARIEPSVRGGGMDYSSDGSSGIPASASATAPASSSPSLSNADASIQVSKMVTELQSISKEQNIDTFEARLADKAKTLMEEYRDVKIYRVQGEPLLYYWIPVARPTVSERSIINTLKEATTRLISLTPYRIKDPEQKRNVYAQQVVDILRASPELKVPSSRFDFYAQAVVTEMVGYGLIDSLIKDDKLEEIMVIGPNVPVYVFHRKYDMMMSNVEFTNDGEIQDLVNRIAREVGRRVDISAPLLDARLPDGSRVNATIPPASVSGSTLTIRKFRADPYSIVDLVKYKTLSVEAAAFLWVCVDGLQTQPANILISGGTSSGKTTLLNVLCSFIPANERVISIEDTSELNLPLRHWIRLEGRPPGLEGKGEITLDILTKNSLRMRPDRIIVGEVRHDEAFSLFTAMNTGHDGCLIPESKIALTSGIYEIGPFVDSRLEKGSWKEGEWDVCIVENETINSVDANGKIFRSPIVQARRKPFEGHVYHIKLASGSEITCTGNHPFYSYADGLHKREAKDFLEGQFLATPSKLARDSNANEPELAYWSGMLHGDGNVMDKQRVRVKNGRSYVCNEGRISIFTEEPNTIPAFVQFMKGRLDDAYVKTVEPRPDKQCYEAHVSGFERSKTIQSLLDIPAGDRHFARMSNGHYTADLRSFVAGFFDAEGYVDLENNALVFTNANEQYIDFFRYALLTEGIVSRKYVSTSPNSTWYRLYIYGLEQVRAFASLYSIRHTAKVNTLIEILSKKITPNTNVDVIPCAPEIIRLLSQAKSKGFSNREVARRAGISQGLLNFIKRNERNPSRSTVKKLATAFESIGLGSNALMQFADADIFWDRVVSIHSFPYSGFVYDLTVNETQQSGSLPHNFVAEGMVVGNSMGTIHANSAQETLVRVTSPPMSVPEVMLSGLNFVIVENLFHSAAKGSFRRVTEIAEVTNVLEGHAHTQTVFEWDPVKDGLQRTSAPIRYLERLSALTGRPKAELELEFKRRERFLQGLMDRDVRDLKTVSALAQEFLGDL